MNVFAIHNSIIAYLKVLVYFVYLFRIPKPKPKFNFEVITNTHTNTRIFLERTLVYFLYRLIKTFLTQPQKAKPLLRFIFKPKLGGRSKSRVSGFLALKRKILPTLVQLGHFV